MLLACFMQLSVFAQTDLPKTQDAIRKYEAGDIMAARDAILDAVQSDQEKRHPYTWYVKGFLYKEIFKQIEKSNPYSENREVAVDAIEQSMAMDEKGEFLENNKTALKFLSISYYNDAVILTRSMTDQNFDEPIQFYERYKRLNSIVDPTADYTAKDVEFYKNMARACRLMYEKDADINPLLFDSMVRYYTMALELAPNEFQSHYNLAVNYYNRGVHKIRKIDHNTEIVELIRIQDECLVLFKEALPYMEKAKEISPDHVGTLKGMMAIHRSLSNDILSKEYQAQIETLINDGKEDDK